MLFVILFINIIIIFPVPQWDEIPLSKVTRGKHFILETILITDWLLKDKINKWIGEENEKIKTVSIC